MEERFQQEELGAFETWDDILFKRHGCLQRVFWKCLHKELRKGTRASNILFSAFQLLVLIHGIGSLSILQVSLMYWILAMALHYPGELVFHEKHADFVNYIAGPLEKVR